MNETYAKELAAAQFRLGDAAVPMAPPAIPNERLTQLFRLAAEIIGQLEMNGVKGRELCLLREMTEMLARARGLTG